VLFVRFVFKKRPRRKLVSARPAPTQAQKVPSWPRRAAARTGHPEILKSLMTRAPHLPSDAERLLQSLVRTLGGRYALPRDAAMTDWGED
jgi:hypothetical protein